MKEATPTAVARRLGLTWDEVRGIQARAIRRGLARRTRQPVAWLGIDEKRFVKRHQYVSVVVDLEEACVRHVADDREAESLVPHFEGLPAAERAGIEAVAMDRWEPYRKTVREHVPEADGKIVFDKFHALQHVSDAVDQVRRQESRALAAVGDTTLKGTKYAWLRNPKNFSAKAWREFGALRESTLQSARAWALKESLRRLWDYTYVGAARTFFKRWYWGATHSRLAPLIKVARMLKRHLDNILTYLTHRITNAVTEGLNAKIQWIKLASRGVRNRASFKTAIYFYCGGLDLEPRIEEARPHPSLKSRNESTQGQPLWLTTFSRSGMPGRPSLYQRGTVRR